MYKTINISEEILMELKKLKNKGEIKSIGNFATSAIKKELEKLPKQVARTTDKKLVIKIEVNYE